MVYPNVARARGGGLRRLPVGAKGKPPVAKLARQPRDFGNEVAFFVEADERRGISCVHLGAIGGRSVKAEADPRAAAQQTSPRSLDVADQL
jgi:hypothetical protein